MAEGIQERQGYRMSLLLEFNTQGYIQKEQPPIDAALFCVCFLIELS
jgi:hypothetical protein